MTDVPNPKGVTAFRLERQPSHVTVLPLCPACGSDAWDDDRVYTYHNSSQGGYDPHLDVRCARCGFSWEEEVATP